jgi:hypothetical protein
VRFELLITTFGCAGIQGVIRRYPRDIRRPEDVLTP